MLKKLCSNITSTSCSSLEEIDDNFNEDKNKEDLKRSNSIVSYIDKNYYRYLYNKKIGKQIHING